MKDVDRNEFYSLYRVPLFWILSCSWEIFLSGVYIHAKLDIFTAMKIQVVAFWFMTPRSEDAALPSETSNHITALW